MTRIALLFPIVLFIVLATPFDGSAEKASRGSLSWLAAAVGERDDPSAEPSVDAGGGTSTLERSAPAGSGSVPAGDNQVTLEIVMRDDAPRPGDEGCDASYPQLCIPHDAPDFDCHEMGVAGFEVLAPDRHQLDEDGDGLGCED
jgi:hypothetical protein